ncbi:MAG TPA: hypothetical protein VFP84_37340 [Kofleriaceae bacterium]|nr:hypothetical protein [Kofleriaceae bacterium]
MVGPRLYLIGALGLTLLVSACAHNVPQDSATGSDGKEKGAKTISLENGEGRASGIVTYPGGDRVDWKLVELPEKKRGALEVKLSWTPPRPGLQLAFDVFDEWNQPVVQSKKTSKKRSAGRIRTATVDSAKGKYFIRVYAVGRGDAGKYKLTVDFTEAPVDSGIDYAKLDIPDPPKLAAVPDEIIPCDETNFDPKKQECKSVCPKFGAPQGWPGCKDVCPTPPDINVQACWASMDCPNPPDRRVRKCSPAAKFWKPCDYGNPDPNNPRCDEKRPPVFGRIIGNNLQGSDVIITIGIGSEAGVGKDWVGKVMRGDSEQPLSGGDVQIIRVDKKVTVGKVHLTTDQLSSNSKVRLQQP